eukprot:scaffold8374_cov175-Amphora_coffeaeformis.AAC.52
MCGSLIQQPHFKMIHLCQRKTKARAVQQWYVTKRIDSFNCQPRRPNKEGNITYLHGMLLNGCRSGNLRQPRNASRRCEKTDTKYT